jgi:hypothetical protein
MKTNSIAVAGSIVCFLCLLMADPAGATGYSLTLTAQGPGTVSRNPTNTSYPPGVVVTLTAAPNAGAYFAGWSGSTNSPVNPLNLTINSDLVITGNFLAYPNYSLTLVTNGQGTIALSPPGGSYLSNTLVTATATPAAGWVFAGWSGAATGSTSPLSFAVDANGVLTGNFAQLPAFDLEPLSVTNKAGSTVSFAAHALGTAPLTYNWFFSGGTLTNATNPTLSLTNITSAQAGNYWVVATNNYGSATSYVASLTLTNSVGPTNVVNSPDEVSLLTAIASGGWVGIGFNGTVTLTNTIAITNNVVLDGTGVGATISGGNAVRLFTVANGASLTISNLTLANGNCLVTNGPPGTAADGGAIYNDGGRVTLLGCTLTNDLAQSMVVGGVARGGAIFNNGGVVTLYQSVLSSNQVVGGGAPDSSGPQGMIGQALGGAIYNTNGSVTLSGCIAVNNASLGICQYAGSGLTLGGAVAQTSGTLTVINSSFGFNQAIGGNGALYPTGYPPTAFPASPAHGGALAATGGSLFVDHDQFGTNEAAGGSEGANGTAGPASGGAIYCSCNCSVSASTFSGNKALAGNFTWGNTGQTGNGGAIDSAGALALNGCAFYLNYAQGGTAGQTGTIVGGAGLGAGLYNTGELNATNCTIAFNTAVGAQAYVHVVGSAASGSALGGGVYNGEGSTFIGMNLTIASNLCSSPAGLVSTPGVTAGLQIANTNGTLRLHNSLIAYSGTNSNAYGPITDDGYNICSDGSASLFSGSSYNYTDPQLGPLGNYGGPTWCMALLASSPAIDTADPNDFPGTDQRGYARPAGGGPDLGAYEYGAVPSVALALTIGSGQTNLMLSFTADPPHTYYLQYSTNLVTWVDVSTNGPFATQTNLSQTITPQNLNRGFFRLLLQ